MSLNVYRIRHFRSIVFLRDDFFVGLKIIVPFDFVKVGLKAPEKEQKKKSTQSLVHNSKFH